MQIRLIWPKKSLNNFLFWNHQCKPNVKPWSLTTRSNNWIFILQLLYSEYRGGMHGYYFVNWFLPTNQLAPIPHHLEPLYFSRSASDEGLNLLNIFFIFNRILPLTDYWKVRVLLQTDTSVTEHYKIPQNRKCSVFFCMNYLPL